MDKHKQARDTPHQELENPLTFKSNCAASPQESPARALATAADTHDKGWRLLSRRFCAILTLGFCALTLRVLAVLAVFALAVLALFLGPWV